jgi:hypothetical protein
VLSLGVAFTLPNLAAAQSQTTATQIGQPNRVSVAYVPTDDLVLKDVYGLLRDRRALERVQEMLSPFRLPEELTIKTAECGVVNSSYRRENFKPTVTICYEYLRHILESLPNEITPAGITAADAAAGQFFWATFHESDTQYSTFFTCQSSDIRKMPPIILQHTLSCTSAEARRGD